MPPSAHPKPTLQDLCGRCGLCCNGVIFADVQLGSATEAARLKRLGLGLRQLPPAGAAKSSGSQPRFKLLQPCAAWQGCFCRIYPDRPAHCRAFECLLYKNLESGRLRTAAAFRIVRSARARVNRVEQLLRQLGDREEQVPLRARFKNVSRRIESISPDQLMARRYSELTIAFHELDQLLRDAFYR